MTATYARWDVFDRSPTQDPATPRTDGDRRGIVTRPVSFDDFYRAQYPKLVGLAFALTGNRMVAEDLVHDAFTEAHRRWDQVADFEFPEAWIRRVLINKSHSRGRRIVSEARMIARVKGRRMAPEAEIELPARSSAVWAAVRKLPKRQAEAITLHYWEDLTVAQIAEILELGEESVKTHLKRGRAKLATLLASEGVEGRFA